MLGCDGGSSGHSSIVSSKKGYGVKFVANIVALLIVLASGFTGSAHAQSRAEPFTERQREILRTVRSVEGYIDEDLHKEFWGAFPDFVRDDPRLPSLMNDLLGEVGDARREFQKHTWLSVQESLAARRVVRTPGYLTSVKAMQGATANAGFQDGIEKSVLSAERLLAAAATGQPLEMPDGPTFITDDLVEQVLSGIDASEFRGRKLASPVWDGTSVRFDYPAAHVSVLAVTPYTLKRKVIATPETGDLEMVMLSQRRGEAAHVFINYNPTKGRYRDPLRSLTSNARAAIEGSGATGRPPVFSKWRGMDSATAAGGAQTSEGDVFVAVRVVEVPAINGVLQFIAASELSLADAMNELGILEEITQIVP